MTRRDGDTANRTDSIPTEARVSGPFSLSQ